MKQITLDKICLTPKLLMTALVILTLSVFSMLVTAAEPDTGERFNHMATGFPLTGQHAAVECSSCHVGGLFKGTARTCSGCHTKGQRVVATTMSSKHLVTTEPCEVCHNNTVTFYGARYNHGKAVTGQCTSCHNGFIATGRPASHTTPNKATKSCDSCHRTFAWLPSTWNHFNTTSGCETCHVAGGEGAAYVKNNIGGTTPEGYAHLAANNAIACRSCHRNYFTWHSATYDHSGEGSGTCTTCHGGGRATPKPGTSVHTSVTACTGCHTTSSWTFNHAGAQGTHVCNSCHQKHNNSTPCDNCHTVSTWHK